MALHESSVVVAAEPGAEGQFPEARLHLVRKDTLLRYVAVAAR